MSRTSRTISGIVAALLLLLPISDTLHLAAQVPSTELGYRLGFSPSVRIQGFTRLGSIDGTIHPDTEESAASSRHLQADLRARTTPQRTFSAEWTATDALVIRTAAGVQNTALQVSARTTRTDGSDPLTFELERVGEVAVWTGSLGVQWRFWRGGVLRPYLGAGLGMSHWRFRQMENVPELEAIVGRPIGTGPVNAVLPAGELLAGADVPLGSWIRIRLEVSDHVSRNPLADQNFQMGSIFEGTGRAEDWVHTLRAGMGIHFSLF